MILPLILPFLGSALGMSPWLAGALGSGLGSLIMNPDDPDAALMAALLGGVTGGFGGGLGGAGKEAATAGLGLTGSGAEQLAGTLAAEGAAGAAGAATPQAVANLLGPSGSLAASLGTGANAFTGSAGGGLGSLGGISKWMSENPMKAGLLAAMVAGGVPNSQGGYEDDYDPDKYPEQFDSAGPRSGYSTHNLPADAARNYGVPGSIQEGEFQFFPNRSAGLSTMPIIPSGTTDEMMGGVIYGPGKGFGDTVEAFSVDRKGEQVPFLLQPGEYVMPKRAVDRIGVRGMDRIREELIRKRR